MKRKAGVVAFVEGGLSVAAAAASARQHQRALRSRWTNFLLALVVLIGATGCLSREEVAEGDRAAEDSLGEVSSNLYQLGPRWDGGVVHICFTNGSTARKNKLISLLNNSWAASGARISFDVQSSCAAALSLARVTFVAGSGGSTSYKGQPSRPGGCGRVACPGYTDVQITNDESYNGTRFAYVVLHEFGHVLSFAHEQERPDNWTSSGQPIFCNQVQDKRKAVPGGTYRTPTYDQSSVMSYCAGEVTSLSAGDKAGAISAYGRL